MSPRWNAGSIEPLKWGVECADAPLSACRTTTSSGKDDAPEDNNNRRFGVRDQPETLVNHKTRREDRGEVEGLKENL